VEEIRPVINVIVRELAPLERFLEDPADGEQEARGAQVHTLPVTERTPAVEEAGVEGQPGGTEVGSSMRAVAPPVQSFAAGRRR
jgi:hypothetical protein